MFLHQSAYLDCNLYRAGYRGHLNQDWKIEHWEEEHLNTHIWETNYQFRNFERRYCHQVTQVAFRAEMASDLVSAVSGGWAEVHASLLRLKRISGFFEDPLWQVRHPFMWFWQSIGGCLSIPAFTSLCPGNSTPSFFSYRTLAQGFLIRTCVCSIDVRQNPRLTGLAMFKAGHMSDCSSWTRPPRLALVADMLDTYKRLVAASDNEIRLLP